MEKKEKQGQKPLESKVGKTQQKEQEVRDTLAGLKAAKVELSQLLSEVIPRIDVEVQGIKDGDETVVGGLRRITEELRSFLERTEPPEIVLTREKTREAIIQEFDKEDILFKMDLDSLIHKFLAYSAAYVERLGKWFGEIARVDAENEARGLNTTLRVLGLSLDSKLKESKEYIEGWLSEESKQHFESLVGSEATGIKEPDWAEVLKFLVDRFDSPEKKEWATLRGLAEPPGRPRRAEEDVEEKARKFLGVYATILSVFDFTWMYFPKEIGSFSFNSDIMEKILAKITPRDIGKGKVIEKPEEWPHFKVMRNYLGDLLDVLPRLKKEIPHDSKEARGYCKEFEFKKGRPWLGESFNVARTKVEVEKRIHNVGERLDPTQDPSDNIRKLLQDIQQGSLFLPEERVKIQKQGGEL